MTGNTRRLTNPKSPSVAELAEGGEAGVAVGDGWRRAKAAPVTAREDRGSRVPAAGTNVGVRKAPKDVVGGRCSPGAGHRLAQEVLLSRGACAWLFSVGLLNGANEISGDAELGSHNKQEE